MLLFKKFSKDIEMWQSIDTLPIYNFHKVMKNADFKPLIKGEITEKKYKIYIEKILKHWEVLYDEYLDHFGLDETLRRVMEIENKIAQLKIERWLEDEKSLESVIKIEQQKLEEIKGKKTKGTSFEEDVAIIEKYRGIGLDSKKTSVKMFYTYIKLMNKDGKKDKRKGHI